MNCTHSIPMRNPEVVECGLCVKEMQAKLDAALLQVSDMRRTLQDIANQRPKNYTPNQEHFEWGNFDDSFQYGYDTACHKIAEMIDTVLNGATPEKPKCGVTIPEGRSGGVSLCDHERPCPIHALKPKQECTCASTGSHAVFCALAVKRKCECGDHRKFYNGSLVCGVCGLGM